MGVRFPLLFLLFVDFSFAGIVHTWHYGSALADTLTSISAYIGSPAFEAVFKFVILLSVILLLLRLASFFGDIRSANPMSLGTFYVVVILVSAVLLNTRVSTTVVDECRGTSHTIDDVPWLVAKPVEWFSMLEKEIRNGMVQYFSVPDSFKRNDGCWTGYEILKPAVTYDAKDPYLRLSMNNYIKDCVVPNIMAGDLDRFALVNSRDLWNDFACTVGQICAALFTTYYSSTFPEGIVDGCPNVYARISFDLLNEYQRAYDSIRDKIFGTGSTVSSTVIPSYLADASSFLMAVGLTGDNLIRQAIAIQQLNQVSAEFATAVAYQERYLSALARINMLDFGRGGTIGALKGVIMTVFSGLIPIMGLLFVSPVGRKVFYVFLTIPAWLGMWSVAEVSVVASLNSFIGKNDRFDFVLSDIDRMNLVFNKAAQISSLMSDYIPLLTFMLVSGSMYAMVQFAKGMTATLSDQHGAKVMASGNFDAGNIRVNTFQQDSMVVANSTFGQVGWNLVSGDNWSVGNKTFMNEQNLKVDGRIDELGLKGYGSGYKTGDGIVFNRFVSDSGVTMENVEVGKDGSVTPVGSNASISAPSATALLRNLGRTDPALAAEVQNSLSKLGLSTEDVTMTRLTFGENGVVLSYKTQAGGQFTTTIGENGQASNFSIGNVGGTTVDGRLVSTSGIPVHASLKDSLRKIGQRERVLSQSISRFKEKTEGWSDVSKAIYSAALRAYLKGEISGEDVEKTWKTLKEMEDTSKINIGGQGETFKRSRDPVTLGPFGVLRRLSPKMQKILPRYIPGINTRLGVSGRADAGFGFNTREREQVGEGGSVKSSYEKGKSGEITDFYGRDFSHIISENLRYAENELRSLRDSYSQIQSKEFDTSMDLNPLLIDRYARENNLSVDEAIKKLSQNNWEGLRELQNRFIQDSEFRNDILKEAKERTKLAEEAGRVNISTSGIENQNLKEGINNAVEQRKQEVEGGVKELEDTTDRNIESLRGEGAETEGNIQESIRDRKLIAGGLVGMSFAASLLGLFPNKIPRVPGTGPKGLPGGNRPSLPGGPKTQPLPGGNRPPGGKPPPYDKEPIGKLGGIDKPEQLREYARKHGIELTDDEAQRMIELRNRLYKTTNSLERVKILEEINNIANKAASRNPEEFAKLQRGIGKMGHVAEKAIVKQVGEEGAKALFKKVPLVGLAMGAYFAYQRAQEGDTKGAILELASGVASTVPGVGTFASTGIDGYLFARDMGIVDDKMSREEFNEVFNKALLQARNLNGEELKQQIWENNDIREQVLETMKTDSNFFLNYQGRQIRLDANGNIYDYSALARKGLSVNTEGQIYDVNTGRIIRNVDRGEFVLGRVN